MITPLLTRASSGKSSALSMDPTAPGAVARRRSLGDARFVLGDPMGLRLDVLVQVEQVVRVVRPLDLDEPIVVASVVSPDPVLVVLRHEVDVAALLCEG